MSTARKRAAAHVEWTVSEGHSIALVQGAFRDGRDGVVTTFDVSEPYTLDARTSSVAERYRHDSDEDRAALKAELIRRGWVQ